MSKTLPLIWETNGERKVVGVFDVELNDDGLVMKGVITDKRLANIIDGLGSGSYSISPEPTTSKEPTNGIQ